LFASGDSQTTARLRSTTLQALRLCGKANGDAPVTLLQEMAFDYEAEQFDIIHSQLDYLGFPMSRRCGTPVLTTLHGQLDLAELLPMFEEFADLPFCSVSNAQRVPLPRLNWQGTVYHGLPALYPFYPRPGSYPQRSDLIMRLKSPAALACRFEWPQRSTPPIGSIS
jgi:hypothetical protein